MRPRIDGHPRTWLRLARRRSYNLQRVASEIGVTVRQIERYFERDLGRTPQDWLSEQRFVEARHLLRLGWQIKEISLHLRFKQVSHFCREFKRVYGMTPTRMQDLLLGHTPPFHPKTRRM